MLSRLRGAFLRPFGAAKHLLTGIDGQTYAPSRVYWCLGALTMIVLSIWHVAILGKDFSATDFSATDFGTGMSAILAAGAAGVWMTRKTEPQ